MTVLFGGWTGSVYSDETWEWNGSAWSQLPLSGPSGRAYQGMAFDLARGVTVLFGGSGAIPTSTADTWELGGVCYPNCDGSSVLPVLNVSDYICFLNRYAALESYANCDGSTVAPTLNVADFICFMNRYAAGCP